MRTQTRRYPTPARTWHVDATAGADTNTGAADKPIQTIAKVNALALKPGDRVLFKCAETWAGTKLTLTKSGMAGRPIVLGAYGVGAAPILDGNGTDGALLIDVGYHDIVVRDLHLKRGSGYPVELNGTYIILDNCEVELGGTNNICIHGVAASTHHLQVRNCTVHNATNTGIYVGHGGTAGGPTDITVFRNTCYSNGSQATLDHGIYVQDGVRMNISKNICYSNFAHGIVDDNNTDAIVASNKCYSNGYAGIWLGRALNNSQVYNNLVYSNVARGIRVNNTAGPVYLYHNTCYNNVFNIDFATLTTGVVSKNNVSLENVTYRAMNIKDLTAIAANTWDYNCYKQLKGGGNDPVQLDSGTDSYTMAEWRASSGSPDANGQDADPVFVTNGSNFHLQVTSPCIAAGVTGLGVLADLDDVVHGVAMDQGCYEYVA